MGKLVTHPPGGLNLEASPVMEPPGGLPSL
jgi:hypothetical protein